MLFSQNISEGGGGPGGSRKSCAHQSKNYIPNTQSISSAAAACDQATLVQAPEVNLWPAMANNTKPGAYKMPNNTESRNTQCPMPGS